MDTSDQGHGVPEQSNRRFSPRTLLLVAAAVAIAAFTFGFLNSVRQARVHRLEQEQANRAMLTELELKRAEVLAEQKEAFEKTGSMALSAERANKLLDSMDESTRGTDTSEARMLRISTAAMRDLAAAATEYEKRVNEVVEMGGLDGAGINAEADLDIRINKWAEVAEFASKLTAQTNGLPDRVKSELEKAKIGSREMAGFMNGMNQGSRFALLGELRLREEEIIAGNREQLRVLKSAYGRWRYDKGEDRVVFQDDADLATYNAAAEKVAQAAEAQTKVQKRMMNINRPPSSSDEK